MAITTEILRQGIYQPVLNSITSGPQASRGLSIGPQLTPRSVTPVSPTVILDMGRARESDKVERRLAANQSQQVLLLAKAAQTGIEQLLEKVADLKSIANRGASPDASARERIFLSMDLADAYKDYNKIAETTGVDQAKVLDGSLAIPIRVERVGDEVVSQGFSFFSLGSMTRPIRAGDQFRIQVGSSRELVYTATRDFSPIPTVPSDVDGDGTIDNQAAEDERVQAAANFVEALSYFGGNGFKSESGFIVSLDPNSLLAGSGYPNGNYTNISLIGGSGSGAKASIEVKGGQVVSVDLATRGYGYLPGDKLSVAPSGLSGVGSGFSIQVSEVFNNLPALADGFPLVISDTINFATPGFSEFLRVRAFLQAQDSNVGIGTTQLSLGQRVPPVVLTSLSDNRIRPLEVGQNAIVSVEPSTAGGSGYLGGADAVSVPVSLFGGTGYGARGIVDIERGIVAKLDLRYLGAGYSATDQLTISLDDLLYRGSGLEATAVTDSIGAIKTLTIQNPGSDYLGGASATRVPVWIDDINGSGFGAEGLATVTQGSISRIDVIRGGINYQGAYITLDFDVGGTNRLSRYTVNEVGENGQLSDSSMSFSGGVLGGASMSNLQGISVPLLGGSNLDPNLTSNGSLSYTSTIASGVLGPPNLDQVLWSNLQPEDIVYADLSALGSLGGGFRALITVDPDNGSISQLSMDVSQGGSAGLGYLGGGTGSNVPVEITGSSGSNARGLADIVDGEIKALRLTDGGYGFIDGDFVSANIDQRSALRYVAYRVQKEKGDQGTTNILVPANGYLGGGSADAIPVVLAGGFPTEQARGVVTIANGQVTKLRITDQGSGYSPGDIIFPKINTKTLSGRGSTGVIESDQSRAVKSVKIESKGDDFLGGTDGEDIPIRLISDFGVGAMGRARIVAGRIDAVEIDSKLRGYGYQDKSITTLELALDRTGHGFELTVSEVGNGNTSRDAILFDKVYRTINSVVDSALIGINQAKSTEERAPKQLNFSGVAKALDELRPVLEQRLFRAKLEVQMLESQVRLFGGFEQDRIDQSNAPLSKQQDNFAMKLSRMLSRAELYANSTISVLNTLNVPDYEIVTPTAKQLNLRHQD